MCNDVNVKIGTRKVGVTRQVEKYGQGEISSLKKQLVKKSVLALCESNVSLRINIEVQM